MKVPNSEKSIEPEEALRALYIDFEGFADQPPALIGVLCGYRFEQVVLDSGLELAARHHDLPLRSLEDQVEQLLARCRKEDRVVVAFSQHEKRIVFDRTGVDLSPSYRDARFIAKRWINRECPSHGIEYSLKKFLEFIGFERGSHLGDGVATKRLRDVRDALAKRDTYASLTPTQKRKWTNLSEHNRIDCCGMRDLVLWASVALAKPA